jgi:hypothetical protein
MIIARAAVATPRPPPRGTHTGNAASGAITHRAGLVNGEFPLT